MPVPTAVSVAVLGGVLIAAQAALLGPFGRAVNPFVAAAWVNVAGAVFSVVAMAVLRVGPDLAGLRTFPWGLLAGIFGVGIVASIGAAVTPLGVGTTLAVATGTQLVVAFAIDAAGLAGRTVPVDAPRVVGVLLIVAGVVMVFGRGEAA